jgi:predicted nucleotidyltransferase
MIDRATIEKVVVLIVQAANPEQVVIFGSHARGDATQDSDLDLLVIETEVEDRHRESTRLRRILSPTRIPVDIVVHSRRHVEEWSGMPGTLLHEAQTEGEVVYERP